MQTSKLTAAAVLLCAGGMVGAAQAEGTPSSKAAVAINPLIALSQTYTSEGPNDTGWQPVMYTQIKTANQKDLLFDVSLQCGIVTDTTVKSTGGNKGSAEARANIAVRVMVDGVPAEPTGSIDATGASAEGVVFCDRIQTLAAQFAGLDCSADLLTGAVTCQDPEELQLILQTLNANAFNFAMTDLSSGVHDIVVEARARASVDFEDDIEGGSLAGAEAFLGAGSVIVEEVRLVKDADIIVDM